MAGQSGHNLNISRSKLGKPRFPFERPGVGDGYAGAGEVNKYRITEEERLALIEKYGPPAPPEKAERIRGKYRSLCGWSGQKKDFSEEGENKVEPVTAYDANETADSGNENAISGNENPDLGNETAISGKNNTDTRNGEPEPVPEKPKTRYEIAKEKLPREEFVRLRKQGKLDKQIYEQLGIHADIFYRLKREYGFIGLQAQVDPEPKEVDSPAPDGQRLTLARVLELQKELTEDLNCIGSIISDPALSAGVVKLLFGHGEKSQEMLDRINKALEAVEVQI